MAVQRLSRSAASLGAYSFFQDLTGQPFAFRGHSPNCSHFDLILQGRHSHLEKWWLELNFHRRRPKAKRLERNITRIRLTRRLMHSLMAVSLMTQCPYYTTPDSDTISVPLWRQPRAHILPVMGFSSKRVSHRRDEQPCCCVPAPLGRIFPGSLPPWHVLPTHSGSCGA